MLIDTKECKAKLQFPNGEVADITHTGNLQVNDDIMLTNVLCVPTFEYNLLSISKLIQGTDSQVNFFAEKCYLQVPTWGKKLDIGIEVNGLYLLSAKLGITSCMTNASCTIAHVANSDIWHARIGHVPANELKLLPVVYKNLVPEVCDSCYLVKQSRLVFPTSENHSAELFDLVHMDLRGPYRFKTRDN